MTTPEASGRPRFLGVLDQDMAGLGQAARPQLETQPVGSSTVFVVRGQSHGGSEPQGRLRPVAPVRGNQPRGGVHISQQFPAPPCLLLRQGARFLFRPGPAVGVHTGFFRRVAFGAQFVSEPYP
jgi:hypothetical protein